MKGQAESCATDSGRGEFLSDHRVKSEIAASTTPKLLRDLNPEEALGACCLKQRSWGDTCGLPLHVIGSNFTGDEGLHRLAKLFVILGVQRAFHKTSA